RIHTFHAPYHAAIAAALARAQESGAVPVIVSVHSFTPRWRQFIRPWETGLLWDRDDRLVGPLMEGLEQEGFTVGDNEPYTGRLLNACMYRHGTANGLPHVLIEIRQDLIETKEGQREWAARYARHLRAAASLPGIREIRKPCPEREKAMDDATRTEVEAAAFRRLVSPLGARPDVQNIVLMILTGSCRPCLDVWY